MFLRVTKYINMNNLYFLGYPALRKNYRSPWKQTKLFLNFKLFTVVIQGIRIREYMDIFSATEFSRHFNAIFGVEMSYGQDRRPGVRVQCSIILPSKRV